MRTPLFCLHEIFKLGKIQVKHFVIHNSCENRDLVESMKEIFDNKNSSIVASDLFTADCSINKLTLRESQTLSHRRSERSIKTHFLCALFLKWWMTRDFRGLKICVDLLKDYGVANVWMRSEDEGRAVPPTSDCRLRRWVGRPADFVAPTNAAGRP